MPVTVAESYVSAETPERRTRLARRPGPPRTASTWLIATGQVQPPPGGLRRRHRRAPAHLRQRGQRRRGEFKRPNGIAVYGDHAVRGRTRQPSRAGADAARLQRRSAASARTELRSPYGLWLHREPSRASWRSTSPTASCTARSSTRCRRWQRTGPARAPLPRAVRPGRHACARNYGGAFGDTSEAGALRMVESIAGDPVNDRLLIADEDRRHRSTLREYTLQRRYTGRSLPQDSFDAEAEGVALWTCPDGGGYWIAVDQLAPLTIFHLFDRVTPAAARQLPGHGHRPYRRRRAACRGHARASPAARCSPCTTTSRSPRSTCAMSRTIAGTDARLHCNERRCGALRALAARVLASPLLLAGVALACARRQGLHAGPTRNGVTHYGDARRTADSTAGKADRQGHSGARRTAARSRACAWKANDGRYLAWADNHLAGPIEVMLQVRGATTSSATRRCRRAPPCRRAAARWSPAASPTPTAAASSSCCMDGLPGDPSARPRDVEYLLPLQQRSYRIDQGFGGGFSHTDPQNRYAVDFAADDGTPVLAAREGVVMQVESDFDKAGLNREKYGGRANFVRILHDDGTHGRCTRTCDPKACWCASASACAPASRSACPATPASPPARTCTSWSRSTAACGWSRSRSACSGRRARCGFAERPRATERAAAAARAPGYNRAPFPAPPTRRPARRRHVRRFPRSRAPPHLRDHLAPRRRQDHADREAAAVRRRDPDGRLGQGPQGRAPRDLRLDGAGEGARHLGDLVGDAVPVRGPHRQPARHARPRRLRRGHLPRADRGRLGADGDRRRQGRRGTHDQADGSVPPARHADHDLHQQARPRGQAADRPARRGRIACSASSARR